MRPRKEHMKTPAGTCYYVDESKKDSDTPFTNENAFLAVVGTTIPDGKQIIEEVVYASTARTLERRLLELTNSHSSKLVKKVCSACEGNGGYFTGDPCHGTESWIPCFQCQ